MPRILLVDDDYHFRTMLRTTLERMGHTVVEARNGAEAIDLYERERADLVLTDLVMPEKEGFETVQELRRIHPAARIITMSGGGRVKPSVYLAVAQQMGVDWTLAKPFSKDELAAAIDGALSGSAGS
jgi:DNA-binding response OmpR family regulator